MTRLSPRNHRGYRPVVPLGPSQVGGTGVAVDASCQCTCGQSGWTLVSCIGYIRISVGIQPGLSPARDAFARHTSFGTNRFAMTSSKFKFAGICLLFFWLSPVFCLWCSSAPARQAAISKSNIAVCLSLACSGALIIDLASRFTFKESGIRSGPTCLLQSVNQTTILLLILIYRISPMALPRSSRFHLAASSVLTLRLACHKSIRAVAAMFAYGCSAVPS